MDLLDLYGSMNFWWTGARSILCEAILVRDTERRGEDGESRSKGYGFIAFKARPSAAIDSRFRG